MFKLDISKKIIFKSAANSLIIQFIIRLKGLITLPIYTYFLAPSEMGVVNLVMSASSLLMPLFSLNMVDGPIVYFSQEDSAAKIGTMYLTVVNAVILSTLLCSGLFGGVGLLVKPGIAAYLPWIILLIWANIFHQLSRFMFEIYQHTDVIRSNSIMRDLGIAVTSILLVALGYSYQGLLFSNIAVTTLTAWLLFRVMNRKIPYSFSLDLGFTKKFLKVAIVLLPMFLFAWEIQSCDYYFLAYFHGKAVVGKYGVVYNIASTIMILNYPLTFFWYPVSARLWIDDREKYRSIFRVTFAAFTSCVLVAVVLFELNAKWIMTLLVRNPEYHDAFIIIGTISFAYSLQVLITLLTAPLYSNKNIWTILASYITGGVVNLLLNIWLIPKGGFIAAAFSTAVSYLLVTLILGFANYRVAAFRFLDARLIGIIPVLIVGWLISLKAQHHATLAGVLPVDLGIVVAVLLLTYTVLLRPDEKEYLLFEVRELYSRFRRGR